MDFLIEVFILFLSIRGRINFLQLARYGKYKEQCYRQQFEKPFDFLAFNKELTLSHGSGKYAIAISKYLVADAWFSKKPFTDKIIASEMHLISRLRDDADLRYLFKGAQAEHYAGPCHL